MKFLIHVAEMTYWVKKLYEYMFLVEVTEHYIVWNPASCSLEEIYLCFVGA
jgi:hypothetical protein